MERLGFTEGVSLEDKRISKGIERAQKKVEERNFSTRKHLLEWDEPMDYQRRAFYSERQHILEGRRLSDLIWRMIDDAVGEVVGDYLAPDYTARRVSDWVRSTLDINIPAEQLDESDVAYLDRRIRQKAKDEIRDLVRTSLGEYIDEEEEPSAWDVGGLLKWAQRMFPVSLTQNQMRKMSPPEIEDHLYEAADAHYDKIDLSQLEVFLDPQYGRGALADWVRGKFGIDLKTEEVAEGSTGQVTEVIGCKVREAYARRERYYPVEAIINRAYSSGSADNVYALQYLVHWANSKYRLGWTTEQFEGKSVDEIGRMLVQAGQDFLEGGRLDREIDEALRRHASGDNGELVAWAKERFGPTLDEASLANPDNDSREILQQAGREMARWELTQLERYVLLRIYDQCWKDHLLEMDHLKYAIMQRPMGGDQTHPQSQYAIEGREQFELMWKTIRSRVTDMIFKVGTGGGEGGAVPTEGTGGGLLSRAQFQFDSATGAGFAGADQAAAMRAQGEAAKPVTIRREQPKVGRNDPCPCGSGKKYKHCHGKRG